jgi:hypothetical protein
VSLHVAENQSKLLRVDLDMGLSMQLLLASSNLSPAGEEYRVDIVFAVAASTAYIAPDDDIVFYMHTCNVIVCKLPTKQSAPPTARFRETDAHAFSSEPEAS